MTAKLMATILAAALSCAASAQESQPGDVAVLRGLEKVTAETLDFEARVGEPVRFHALSVLVRYCRKRPPEETPETYVFLEIYDRRTDSLGRESEGEKVFSGWMFGSNPALNPLDHRVYDVWPIDCKTSSPEASPENE